MQDDGHGVLFAQLNGAYWLDAAGEDCRECDALLAEGACRPTVPADGHRTAALGWGRLRVVILPVALLTVTAAVLVGVLT